MTRTEHLWLKLMEECAEVQHRTSKLLQFGPMENGEHGEYETNIQRLRDEVNDILSVLTLLEMAGALPYASPADLEEAFTEKRAKIEYFLRYSERLGMVSGR